MSKLDRSIKDWVKSGLITEEQAMLIQVHEGKKPERSWVLTSFLILGVVNIGIGLISLIAYNWYQIPDELKIAGDFALLIITAFVTWKSSESKKTIQFEILLLFFMLLCLASIGLFAQIFHTDYPFYQEILFWSLITLPVCLASRQLPIPFFWTGAFLFGVVFSIIDSELMKTLFDKNLSAFAMTIPLLYATFIVTAKKFAGERGITKAFRYWTIMAGLGALFTTELPRLTNTLPSGDMFSLTPGYFLTAIIASAIWLSSQYRYLQKVLLLSLLTLYLIPFHLSQVNITASVVYATTTILVLSVLAIFLASLKERVLFQRVLLLVGFRFIILYFQALGGLATTGFGLVLSGLLILALTLFWNKHNATIAAKVEGWAQ